MATIDDEGQDEEEGRGLADELRDLCLEADVKFIACQMTVDLFEFEQERLHRRHRVRRRRDLHEVRRRNRRLPVHLRLPRCAHGRQEPAVHSAALGAVVSGRLRARLRLRCGRQQDQLLHHGRGVRRRQHGPLGPHAHVAAGDRGGHRRRQPAAATPARSTCRRRSTSGPTLPWLSLLLGGAAVRRGHDAGRRLRQQEPDPRSAAAACARWWCWSSWRIASYMTLKGLFGQWRAQLARPGGHRPGRASAGRTRAWPRAGHARPAWRRSAQRWPRRWPRSCWRCWLFVFKDRRFRGNPTQMLGARWRSARWWSAGWYVSGHLGFGENPDTLETVYFAHQHAHASSR